MSEAGEERQGAAARRRRRRRGGGSGTARAAGTASGPAAAAAGRADRTGTASSQRTAAPASRKAASARGRSARDDINGASSKEGPAGSPGRPRSSSRQGIAPRIVLTPPPPSVADAQLAAHELADAQNEERRRANARRQRLLTLGAAAAPAIVLGVILGVVAGIVAGAAVAVVVFVAVALSVSMGSMRFALGLVGGRTAAEGALPALVNQVEGLCATIGVARPELRVVDDPVANACALAGRGGQAVLVVTSGLLSRVGLIEMEGVVAHELVHLKRRDAAVSSVALATVGIIAWATGRDELVHAAVGRGREYGADQAAALAVRYPPGLHDALASMGGQPSSDASPFTGRRWAATRWIWIDPVLGVGEGASVGELDATRVRIDALAEW